MSLDEVEVALDTPADELLALDELLEDLCRQYPDCGGLVKFRRGWAQLLTLNGCVKS